MPISGGELWRPVYAPCRIAHLGVRRALGVIWRRSTLLVNKESPKGAGAGLGSLAGECKAGPRVRRGRHLDRGEVPRRDSASLHGCTPAPREWAPPSCLCLVP